MLNFPVLRQMPPEISAAERLIWELEKADGWDREWRRQKFSLIPPAFSLPIAEEYQALWHEAGEQKANQFLLGISDELSCLVINPKSSDDDLVAMGKRIANNCRRAFSGCVSHTATASHLLRICDRYGIRPPVGLERFGASTSSCNRYRNRSVSVTAPVSGTVTDSDSHSEQRLGRGIVARLIDDAWWRRKLRVIHGRILEGTAIRMHQVHRYAGIYISDASLSRHQQQQRRNQRMLSSLVAENEDGDSLSMEEIVEHSLANPANRRAELMVRIYGFDQLATELGHVAVLLTVTCPSRMHSHLGSSGKKNPNFDGTSTPRTSQQYLAKIWSRIRAKWLRQGIRPYGFRITEPHHDGTPHWHILLFVEPIQLAPMADIVRHYALADTPEESGAGKHRFRIETIDPAKGSATGYVAKYISKNIDGFGIDPSEDGEAPVAAAQRVRAWSSTWGIRQFQQVGGPPVGLWRELRRVPEFGSSDTILGALANAADCGDWKEFVTLLGGPQVSREALPVHLEKQLEGRLGRYGEPLGLRVVGVRLGNVIFSTRFHNWTIKRKEQAQNCTVELGAMVAAAEATINARGGLGLAPPWSSVNNCTETIRDTFFWGGVSGT